MWIPVFPEEDPNSWKGEIPRYPDQKAPGGIDVYEFGKPITIENWEINAELRHPATVLTGDVVDHPYLCQFASNCDPLFASNVDPSGAWDLGLSM